MFFVNRNAAGRQLAELLREYAGRNDVTVLGVPRGGVPVAAVIAHSLRAPLDVFLARKLGVPGNEELAFGAVSAAGERFLDPQTIAAAGITSQQIDSITAATRQLLVQREALYRGGRPPLAIRGRVAILVDDGVATGASIYAAIRALQAMTPAQLILAVPVIPPSARNWLESKVDKLICLDTPRDFYAVGQFYQDFSQVDDETVIALLKASDQPQSSGSEAGTLTG